MTIVRIDDLFASDLVWEYLGDGNWDLMELDSGWLVTWGHSHHVGTHLLFVERDSGTLLLFPVGVLVDDLAHLTPETRALGQPILSDTSAP